MAKVTSPVLESSGFREEITDFNHQRGYQYPASWVGSIPNYKKPSGEIDNTEYP